MKETFKKIIIKVLWLQVRRLQKKHTPIVIAVAGSVGKTGTKTAIATVLSRHMSVAWQKGNYNDIISVPLIFFNQKMPNIYNVAAWIKILIVAEYHIQTTYAFEAVVLEVGTDYRGNMELFKQHLHADYGVLTAISEEHMENFKDIDDVAEEELLIDKMSDTVIASADAVDKKYIKQIDPLTYGEGPNDCRITIKSLTKNFKRTVIFTTKDDQAYKIQTSLIGKQNIPALAAAVLLASKLELTEKEIIAGLESITQLPGRMQLLKGEKGSLIIDDTYNAAPDAVISALDTLYEASAKQKIAILGQMNELGSFSETAHRRIGKHCNPKELSVVITIGPDANTFIAEEAEKRGCKVMRCPSPYHSADVARQFISVGTLVLVKGSQNQVFAEEAVKQLLDNPEDSNKLVRQSKSWLRIKNEQFQR